MAQLPPSMEYKFKMYINVLPVVEQVAMYVLFALGLTLIVIIIYRVAFQVMFKNFNKNVKKQRNIVIGSDIWIEKEKNKEDVYKACEVPASDDSTDSDEAFSPDRRGSGFLKTHSDRIKDLSHKLSDRVYDSVGSVKDKVRDELTHVRNIFKDSRKNSLITQDESNINEAYKTDSSEESEDNNQNTTSDTDEDCKYLEVIDDGIDFSDNIRRQSINSEAINRMNILDSNTRSNRDDLILNLSD